MERPSSLLITTSGNGTPVPLDYYVNGYAVSVTMKTAGAVYTLQYSLSDPYFDFEASEAAGYNVRYSTSYNVSGVWFNCDDPLLVNASTNRVTNFAFVPRAVRVSVSAKCSAGNPITLTVVPFGMDGN